MNTRKSLWRNLLMDEERRYLRLTSTGLVATKANLAEVAEEAVVEAVVVEAEALVIAIVVKEENVAIAVTVSIAVTVAIEEKAVVVEVAGSVEIDLQDSPVMMETAKKEAIVLSETTVIAASDASQRKLENAESAKIDLLEVIVRPKKAVVVAELEALVEVDLPAVAKSSRLPRWTTLTTFRRWLLLKRTQQKHITKEAVTTNN